MTLQVYTSITAYTGDDKLNVTTFHAFNNDLPWVFAPSFDVHGRWHKSKKTPPDWERFVAEYREEMKRSYMEFRPQWDALLGLNEVTLCCYCIEPNKCHRTVLAGLLAKCGARNLGERPFPNTPVPRKRRSYGW